MKGTVIGVEQAALGFSQWLTSGSVLRAWVERKDYGADIELSDGRRCSLWEYAVTGPVMDAAVDWARRQGAAHVIIRN